ncbi:signal recognition particle-docking protein FtsY [Selenomonas sputigena]|jgi:signal recognition particle-docking protein ftsY|uniref:Signal recognition particle receptor FtsY n=1 Tax=Selenomonas sputigena (strain ATCC 35185 / DSM 20758 / CCUG 44933 / VPI D19B-28) TaxID=546271 RepID=C9LW81_SELS3|nr:signal recognition particle-docking protein FtsY [Selenomonas sputigena]AEB99863.1 signal recognition particle-docking protein FtsY [Selenomonas sputigena ATCC 35185]EEX76884.1 signal recognition particle-docking protein FtsY [Selenomonas sputigena ATCC 35185]UZD43713.1 signal recognition particle-docking protein FtsY [Selenomonas sputigena]
MGFFDRLKKGLAKTRETFTNKIEKLIIGYADIDDDLLDELEETLIMSDVGVKTTERLMADVRKGIKKKDINTPEDLKPFLAEKISEILSTGSDETRIASAGPTVLLVIGVNGVGKTTTIGKLAAYYKEQGKSVMLAAADTFRAAAIDQLQIWGDRTGVPVIRHEEGSDPAAVAFDAVKAARARSIDVLIIDTAGRLHTKSNLMEELKKINRVIQREIAEAPHETLLVLDATTGQNAISQADLFQKAAAITGIVLTKLDGTAKGGVIIGLKSELSMPVKWIGVGEGVDDLRPFIAKDFARALFGLNAE